MKVDPAFLPALTGFELERLDALDASVYAFDADFRVRFVNEGWERFRRENGGDPIRCGLGASVLEVLSEPLADYYDRRFRSTLAGASWEASYECSSPDEFRSFRMLVYPLKGEVPGGLVVNAPIVRRPHDGEICEHGPAYVGPGGLVLMCSCCRRVRHQGERERWDWVPALLSPGERPISHGLCYPCFVHYYSD